MGRHPVKKMLLHNESSWRRIFLVSFEHLTWSKSLPEMATLLMGEAHDFTKFKLYF